MWTGYSSLIKTAYKNVIIIINSGTQYDTASSDNPPVPDMTYNVFGGTLNLTQSI